MTEKIRAKCSTTQSKVKCKSREKILKESDPETMKEEKKRECRIKNTNQLRFDETKREGEKRNFSVLLTQDSKRQNNHWL